MKYTYKERLHTIIETACTVVVSAIEDCVHALGSITCGYATWIVDSVAAAWVDEDTVGLLAVQRHRCADSARVLIVAIGFCATCSTPWRRLCEVVGATRLIVDDCNEASRASTEAVLRRRVGYSTSRDCSDVGRLPVRGTRDLV